MAEPWIRVHANVADKPVIWRAVKELGISQNEAIGILVRFWGEMSQHGNNGLVISLTDQQIDAWGGWRGKAGRFAAFVRRFHADEDGRVNEWDTYAGKLEDRRERDRKRKKDERDRRKKLLALSADSPMDIPVDGPPGRPADTPMEVPQGSLLDEPQERPQSVRTDSVPARAVRDDTIRGTTRATTRSKTTTSRDESAGDLNGSEKPPRETWLTPVHDAWESCNGAGTFELIAGEAARALAPLHKAGHHQSKIGIYLEVYLDRTEARFRSITKFAQTFAEWEPKSLVDENGILTPETLARHSR